MKDLEKLEKLMALKGLADALGGNEKAEAFSPAYKTTQELADHVKEIHVLEKFSVVSYIENGKIKEGVLVGNGEDPGRVNVLFYSEGHQSLGSAKIPLGSLVSNITLPYMKEAFPDQFQGQ